jgi:2-methylisocitrate lyase-like PEP mutase family enzyme
MDTAANPARARTSLATAARQLRSMHQPGNPLVLVNAWDAATARRVVAAGGRAVATSSAAIAGSLGLLDDPSAPVDPLFDAIHRIASAVEVPVTADVLDGYGLEPAELIDRLLGAGAVGCNIEDSDHARPGQLLPAGEVAGRLEAVRSAAAGAGVNIVINARVDSYLHNGPEATPDVVDRARAYLAAGADCIYPVRLTDPRTVTDLVDRLGAPINANLAGSVAVGDLAAAGASRISIGPAAFHAALASFDTIASGMLGGGERSTS